MVLACLNCLFVLGVEQRQAHTASLLWESGSLGPCQSLRRTAGGKVQCHLHGSPCAGAFPSSAPTNSRTKKDTGF